MATNGQIVSRIINDLNFLNKDEHVSRRWILNILKEKTKFAIQQQIELKTLFRDDSMYSWLRCLELERDNIIKCPIIEFRSCRRLMKSVKKLPEPIYSKFGDSVRTVISIDGEHEFVRVTPRQYRLNKQRDTQGTSMKYFYVQDGYLYLPDSDVEMVDVLLLTMEMDEIDKVSECTECDECKSKWDEEFVGTEKLQELVVQDTIREVSTIRGIQEDENPNRDSNIKTQTNR